MSGDGKWYHALVFLGRYLHLRLHLLAAFIAPPGSVEQVARCGDAGNALQSEKAQIPSLSINLLGFTIDREKVAPNQERLPAILESQSPTDVKRLLRFLGMVNYYHAIIGNCSMLHTPLLKLLRKADPSRWGDIEERVKRRLLFALSEKTSLRLPDLTDASDVCLGAVVDQDGDDKHSGLRPVASASCSFSNAERNYNVPGKECVSIMLALNKLYHYAKGVPFIVETDEALKWLSRLQEPTGRLARCILKLQYYEFEVRYREETANAVADALSMAPMPNSVEGTAEHGLSDKAQSDRA